MKAKEIFFTPRHVDITIVIIIVLGAGTISGTIRVCYQISCVVKYASVV